MMKAFKVASISIELIMSYVKEGSKKKKYCFTKFSFSSTHDGWEELFSKGMQHATLCEECLTLWLQMHYLK